MKLFISDLDKTLMDDHHQISPANLNAIHALKESGYEVAVATGRSYDDMLAICKKYDLKVHLIASNGAQVYQEDGRVLMEILLPYDEVIRLAKYCDARNIMYQIFSDAGRFTKQIDQLIYELYALGANKFEKTEDILRRAQGFYDLMYRNPLVDERVILSIQEKKIRVFKMELTSSREEYLLELRKKCIHVVQCSNSSRNNLEITALHTHKAVGVRALCDYLHIPMGDYAAIGDQRNDFELLKQSSYAIAMGNAVPEIKAISNMVTKDVNEDGFAYAVSQFLHLSK